MRSCGLPMRRVLRERMTKLSCLPPTVSKITNQTIIRLYLIQALLERGLSWARCRVGSCNSGIILGRIARNRDHSGGARVGSCNGGISLGRIARNRDYSGAGVGRRVVGGCGRGNWGSTGSCGEGIAGHPGLELCGRLSGRTCQATTLQAFIRADSDVVWDLVHDQTRNYDMRSPMLTLSASPSTSWTPRPPIVAWRMSTGRPKSTRKLSSELVPKISRGLSLQR